MIDKLMPVLLAAAAQVEIARSEVADTMPYVAERLERVLEALGRAEVMLETECASVH